MTTCDEQTVREYPDIPAKVVGTAAPAAAQAIWEALIEWLLKEKAAKNENL